MSGDELPRRRLLTGLAASGVIGLGATGAAGAQSDDARVRPPAEELIVQPGTQLMFEVDPDASEPGDYPQWYVDGENEELAMGPWYSAYHEHQGTQFWLHEIDTDCRITVDPAPRTDGSETTTWTIETGRDGIASPSIRDTHPPTDETRDLEEGTTLDCELEVSDPDGNLDRVVWWALAADYVIDVSDISGSGDTASIAPDASEIVPEGIVAWVISENGAYVESDRWEFDYHSEGATFEVSNVRTNSAVAGGETLEATATIRNAGSEYASTDAELVVGHDPDLVDTESVALDAGESTEVTLTFEAGQPTGGREVFPGEITAGDDTVEFTIVVDDDESDPARFEVMETSTNSPVGGGETLTVETTIENAGGETGRTDIELVVGHDPTIEDSVMRTLGPGESSTFTLSFRAGQPTGGREEFPVVVDTGADTESETVVVS